MTPFLDGQQAYRDGKAKDANPHKPEILTGDQYPGPWKNWRDGWVFEKKLQEASK